MSFGSKTSARHQDTPEYALCSAWNLVVLLCSHSEGWYSCQGLEDETTIRNSHGHQARDTEKIASCTFTIYSRRWLTRGRKILGSKGRHSLYFGSSIAWYTVAEWPREFTPKDICQLFQDGEYWHRIGITIVRPLKFSLNKSGVVTIRNGAFDGVWSFKSQKPAPESEFPKLYPTKEDLCRCDT